jgi:hypothetical protein
MTKSRPKGPTPSLIGGANGRPRRADVGKLSHCYRCNEELLKGTTCVEIPQLGQAYSTVRRVCDECFGRILSKTEEDLEKVRQLLQGES